MNQATPILASCTTSISDLKKNPTAVVASGDGCAVAVLNHNRPAFYCVPSDMFEEMMEALDDVHLLKIARQRSAKGDVVKVSIDDL